MKSFLVRIHQFLSAKNDKQMSRLASQAQQYLKLLSFDERMVSDPLF
jgi:hypothetical protein